MKKVKFFSFWLFLSLCAATTVFNSYGQSSTSDKGVVINGVKWATRNVAAPGTFVAKPKDSGMLYQWNRKKAWPTIGTVTGWNSSIPIGNSWEKANDPSPAGWRVPTLAEIKTLLDADRVSNEWTTENGIYGRKFIDKATGNTLFLPAAGNRTFSDGKLSGVGTCGYWSSAQGGSNTAHALCSYDDNTFLEGLLLSRCNGFSIRSVAVFEATATFKVTVPASTFAAAFVGIVGNLSDGAIDWSPGALIMQRQSDGTYTLTKNIPTGFQYKYVVSADGVTWSWDYCEDRYGNRKMPVNLQANDVVDKWTNEPWQGNSNEEGVIINSVKWATRNVGIPGTFATKPEDAGMFYQWNRIKAWSTTGDIIDWDGRNPTGNTWAKANDPCPTGWRVPTFEEILTLLDTRKVSNEWTTLNGVNGRIFTDVTTGNSLFLPAAGNRYHSNGTLYDVGEHGCYWSSKAGGSSISAYGLFFSNSNKAATNNYSGRGIGLSVRAVAE